MYHPYFRGKQFELITIRESADIALMRFCAATFSRYQMTSAHRKRMTSLEKKDATLPGAGYEYNNESSGRSD